MGGHDGGFGGRCHDSEESNPGYTWDWNEQSLVGKLFGGKFREEEYIYNGKIYTSTKCIGILPIEGIEGITPPEKKCVETRTNGTPLYGDDDIPF